MIDETSTPELPATADADRSDGSLMIRQRIVVISDLHMTAGRNAETGGWSPTEDFFQDDEFSRFLEHYCRDGRATTLVINGDLFDFLQVLEFPDGWKKDRGKEKAGKDLPGDHRYVEKSGWDSRFSYTISLSDINPTYGLRCTMEATRFLAGRIVEGHELFFQALVRFVSHDGNRVVILKGNHDIQLFWSGVQREFIERMAFIASNRMPGGPVGFDPARVLFKPWFYHVPGLAWIEHGNQYEYTTSFVNFLVPTLPFAYDETGDNRQRRKSEESGAQPVENEGHIELDFSSFLVRYLTNPGEPLNPLADNIRPLTRYWEGMWREHPFFVLGTVRAGLVLILKAFAKSSKMRVKTGWNDRAMSDANLARMTAEAAETDLPLDVLKKLDACKEEPTMAHGPAKVLWWFFKPMIVGLLWVVPLFIVTANVTTWVPDPGPDSGAGWIERTGTTVLQGLILLATGAGLLWIRQYIQRVKSWRRLRRAMAEREKARNGEKPELVRSTVHDMRTMAAYISRLIDVPYITFGHTHYADIHRLEDRTDTMGPGSGSNADRPGNPTARDRWYFNTGTWMAIFEPREQLYREARQLTFLEITREEDLSTNAELRCWYPPQSDSRPVVVVDMEELDNGIENGILMSTIRGLGGLGGRR